MEVPKEQIATLIEHGLYDSAEMLGCFLVSSPTVSAETSPQLKAENLVKLLSPSIFSILVAAESVRLKLDSFCVF
jgi:anaphase-promoting complex subunit 7